MQFRSAVGLRFADRREGGAGRAEDHSPQRPGDCTFRRPGPGESYDCAADDTPCPLARVGRRWPEVSQGQVGQVGAPEFRDCLLDQGAAAVVGLNISEREVSVGDERV